MLLPLGAREALECNVNVVAMSGGGSKEFKGRPDVGNGGLMLLPLVALESLNVQR
jgi:hypothetical protein